MIAPRLRILRNRLLPAGVLLMCVGLGAPALRAQSLRPTLATVVQTAKLRSLAAPPLDFAASPPSFATAASPLHRLDFAAAPAKPLPWGKLLLAGSAGAAAGALVGARGLSFASVAPSTRSAHEWRAGLTVGAIGGALALALATRAWAGPAPASASDFWWNGWNTPLLAGMVAVHVLDFTSTRYFRNRGKDEWLLTNHLVDNRAAFVATETAAAAAGIGLMYLLHRTGHDRLERWVAAGYITLGVASAVANYRYPSTGHGLFGQ